jgi:hypothetical protein
MSAVKKRRILDDDAVSSASDPAEHDGSAATPGTERIVVGKKTTAIELFAMLPMVSAVMNAYNGTDLTAPQDLMAAARRLFDRRAFDAKGELAVAIANSGKMVFDLCVNGANHNRSLTAFRLDVRASFLLGRGYTVETCEYYSNLPMSSQRAIYKAINSWTTLLSPPRPIPIEQVRPRFSTDRHAQMRHTTNITHRRLLQAKELAELEAASTGAAATGAAATGAAATGAATTGAAAAERYRVAGSQIPPSYADDSSSEADDSSSEAAPPTQAPPIRKRKRSYDEVPDAIRVPADPETLMRDTIDLVRAMYRFRDAYGTDKFRGLIRGVQDR